MAGATCWLHVMGNETVTAYRLGARGDIRQGYAGTAVHDRFAAYGNTHLLRNLEEIVELEQAPDGWAARMQQLLLEARDVVAHWHDTTGGPVTEAVRAKTGAAWDALLAPGLEHCESLPPPDRGRRRGHNLARALWQEREACLRFLADPAVPFTNIRAERDRELRPPAGPGRDRPPAAVAPARPPAAVPGRRGAAAARPALTRRRRRRTAPQPSG